MATLRIFPVKFRTTSLKVVRTNLLSIETFGSFPKRPTVTHIKFSKEISSSEGLVYIIWLACSTKAGSIVFVEEVWFSLPLSAHRNAPTLFGSEGSWQLDSVVLFTNFDTIFIASSKDENNASLRCLNSIVTGYSA